VSDVDTRRSGRHWKYGSASRVPGKRSSGYGNDDTIEDPAARGVTAYDKRAPLIFGVAQPYVSQDIVDVRAQLVVELLLRLLGLVPGLCALDVIGVTGSGDSHVGAGNGCDFLTTERRYRMAGMRLLRAGACGADDEENECTPP
jgi:hypothetical protein